MKVTLCQAVGGKVGETIEREDGEWLVQQGYATRAGSATSSTSGSATSSTSPSTGPSAKAKAKH